MKKKFKLMSILPAVLGFLGGFALREKIVEKMPSLDKLKI